MLPDMAFGKDAATIQALLSGHSWVERATTGAEAPVRFRRNAALEGPLFHVGASGAIPGKLVWGKSGHVTTSIFTLHL